MPDYVEDKGEFEVPGATGVQGYLRVVQSILELPRVQEVVISIGKVSYRRFRRAGEPKRELEIELDSLLPSSIVRRSALIEIPLKSGHAAEAVAELFARAHMDGLNPVAFVSGRASHFRQWHVNSTGIVLPNDEAYGLPMLLDGQMPDEALVLCAAYGRRAALVDTVRGYKITIPNTTTTTRTR